MAFHPKTFKPLIVRDVSESIVYALEFQVNYDAWIRRCFKKQKSRSVCPGKDKQ